VVFFMSTAITTAVVMIGSTILFFIGLTLYIRASHNSKRLSTDKKKLYHWDGKGYYQKILK
jgi:hypothetical protein